MVNRSPIARRRSAGFSLIEFMIAITISLVILAALSTMFVNSSRARDELQRSNELIENGRYATQVLADDLQLAGYYAELDIDAALGAGTPLALPTSKPNACATTLADLELNFPVHIQGYDNANGALTCLPADYKANTDVVVIRRVSTCTVAACSDGTVAGAPYFQVSLCNDASELSSDDATNHYDLDVSSGTFTRTQLNCATLAPLRRLKTHIYFIASNNEVGDGIPTLKRAELRGGAFTVTPLVEGVEEMHFEYGIDDTLDGAPDAYTTTPDTHDGCAGPAAACSVTNWRNVVSVKMHLLARTLNISPGHTDVKDYSLGLDAAGNDNTVGPFNDSFKRHAFTTFVRLVNPAERRQQ